MALSATNGATAWGADHAGTTTVLVVEVVDVLGTVEVVDVAPTTVELGVVVVVLVLVVDVAGPPLEQAEADRANATNAARRRPSTALTLSRFHAARGGTVRRAIASAPVSHHRSRNVGSWLRRV